MKFTIGDIITLRKTGEEGVISAIISNEMVEVTVRGISFPAYTDEVDHPYLKWFTQKQKTKPAGPPVQLPVEKLKERLPRLATGIYLSFLPVFKADDMEDIVTQLKIYLINELDTPVHFEYEVKTANETIFTHKGSLCAFSNIFLHGIPYEDMNDRPRFNWLVSSQNDLKLATENGQLIIKTAKLYQHISSLLQKNEPAFSYLLLDKFKEKPKDIKAAGQAPILSKKENRKKPKITALTELPRYEVDLHIEQLIPSHKGMNNTDIMYLQLQTLQRNLELAIRHRQHTMVVIHGLGSGALRDAVHKLLKEYPQVARYSNEWMGRYGFGATEVVFQY